MRYNCLYLSLTRVAGFIMAEKPQRNKRKPILRTDPMAEAGRKILAEQIRRMRRREAGSRTGEDIEDVHQMRVAIRRMRSLLNLIGAHYRAKTVRRTTQGLREIARALGAVRDLDVLILDLDDYAGALPCDERETMAQVIALLDARRSDHRRRLNKLFDSKRYRQFVRRFRRMCKRPGAGARVVKRKETPHQLRHVLPLLLHGRLARVRAYDTVLPAANDVVLHALRVEFKQLRYAVEFFQPVLGASARRFLVEVKAMQEILGRINDIAVFADYMNRIEGLSPRQTALVEIYIAARDHELIALREQFIAAWARFNSRTTQRHFADSLLVLR